MTAVALEDWLTLQGVKAAARVSLLAMGFDVLDQGLRIGYGKQESFSFTELGILGLVGFVGLPALTVLAPGMILPLGVTLGIGGVDDALGKGMPLLAGFRATIGLFGPKIAEKLTRLPSRFVSREGTPLEPKGTGRKINIYGDKETAGFEDYATEPRFANGRPLTSTLPDRSASDISLRDAPLSQTTLAEIQRIAQPGARGEK